jgi:hypothetical protein
MALCPCDAIKVAQATGPVWKCRPWFGFVGGERRGDQAAIVTGWETLVKQRVAKDLRFLAAPRRVAQRPLQPAHIG